MSIALKELQENRNSLLMKMQTVAMHKDGWNADRRSQFDKMNAEVTTLEADIQRSESMASFEREGAQFTRSARPGVGNGAVTHSGSGDEERSAINKAFRSYARTGQIAEEHRALLTTSDATGGALIPQLFSGVLEETLKYYGPIATKVRQKITDGTGAPLKVSLANDTSNGLVLLATEGTSGPAETDPTFVSRIVGVDTVSAGLVKVSFEELADSSFSLDSMLRDLLGIRYARGLERAVTLGVDSASTTLPNSVSGGLLGIASSSGTTASVAAGIGWDDLTTMFSALDPAYAISPNWVMNSSTRAYLIGLKDGFGRPYFQADPSSSAPFSSIMGFPIVLNQSMPSMGASATPIAFGDLDKSLMLRTDGQPSVLRLNERYADTLEVGFFLYSRVGSISLVNGGTSLVKLTQASS